MKDESIDKWVRDSTRPKLKEVSEYEKRRLDLNIIAGEEFFPSEYCIPYTPTSLSAENIGKLADSMRQANLQEKLKQCFLGIKEKRAKEVGEYLDRVCSKKTGDIYYIGKMRIDKVLGEYYYEFVGGSVKIKSPDHIGNIYSVLYPSTIDRYMGNADE